MDALLARLGVQAMNYAIRTVDDKGFHSELKTLQKLLNSKIKIISPAIDLIEFKSGRGNVFLESAVPLAKSLHREIISLGKRLENAAAIGEDTHSQGSQSSTSKHDAEVAKIIADIKILLQRIDRDIPLLQLAITASGESLSTSLPPGVSPSRLLQASTCLIIGDTQYANDPDHAVHIGPAFTLSLYMLFLGHASTAPAESSQAGPLATPSRRGQRESPDKDAYGFGEGDRKPLWQEVIHKARVRLCRTPLNAVFDGARGYVSRIPDDMALNGLDPSWGLPRLGSQDEFSYHLEIIEDLDDNRVHDLEGGDQQPYDDVARAGIRESVPIHQLSKIFYTDTGRILNIGNATAWEKNPVLLLKRDPRASPPRKMADRLGEDPDVAMLEDMIGDDECSTQESDDQADIDRQLLQEVGDGVAAAGGQESPAENQVPRENHWSFPAHLDPEWIALEVFEEDGDEDSDGSTTDADDDVDGDGLPKLPASEPRASRNRSSLDSKLMAQFRNISLLSSPLSRKSAARVPSRSTSREFSARRQDPVEASFVARSPFGAITTSLSLMEMLIRLTSLQEFQQASHLSIPDHILTFFLEETSTTGLRDSSERWKVRNEAKRRVGFDPYTDTPR